MTSTAPRRTPRPRRRRDIAVVAVLAAAAVVVGVLLVGQTTTDPAPDAGSAAGPPSAATGALGPLGDPSRRIPGDPTALGRPDAPVVMVMYSDYRCPFCAQFSRDTEDALARQYVDPGALRIEWRDYPIFGPQSTSAAAAGRAAAAQDRFWAYNRAIFADAPQRGHMDLPDETLVRYAEQAGVPDIDRFRRDMSSPATAQAVRTDLAQASTLGVPSTPAFVINGNPMLGAQPIDQFRQEINTALGAVR